MASKNNEKKASLGALILVIVVFGTIGILLLLPLPLFQAVREAEQRQIISWLGADTDNWIMGQIIDLLRSINTEITDLYEQRDSSGNEKLDRWLLERTFAATVWMQVIFYRGGMLLLWMLFALPCMAAAVVDGHYRREIAKATFSSQSPMMHRRGMQLAKAVSVVMVAWLFVPVFVSTWVAPVAIAGLSYALWLWIGNLQKRM